ncbi:MAG: DUF2232 domain-containing protein [Ruminococcaceae bacterium]|nr:DUF2232 domain-containing protein [Oscillospiraceae bacterium]
MKTNSVIKGYLFLAVSFISCLLSCLSPALLFVTAIITISFFVLACPFVHKPFLVIVPVLSVAFSLFSGNNYYITFLIFSIFLTAGLIYFLITKGKSVKEIFFASTVFEAICASLTLLIFIYMRGGSLSANAIIHVFSPLTTPLRAYFDNIIQFYEVLSPEYAGQISEIINQSFTVIEATLQNAIFSIIISFVCYILFFALFISRNLLRLSGFDVSKMGRFNEFSLERSSAVVMIICLFGQMLFENSLGIAFYNLYTVLSTIFIFVGIGVIAFFMNKSNISLLAQRILLFLLVTICILPLGVSSLIGALGVVDVFFGIRKKIANKKKS